MSSSIQPGSADGGTGGFFPDFGKGSREQTQGGPTRRRDNGHPIRAPGGTAPARA